MSRKETAWGQPITKSNVRSWAKRARLELRDMEAAMASGDFESAAEYARSAACASSEAETILEAFGQGGG